MIVECRSFFIGSQIIWAIICQLANSYLEFAVELPFQGWERKFYHLKFAEKKNRVVFNNRVELNFKEFSCELNTEWLYAYFFLPLLWKFVLSVDSNQGL